MSRVLVVGPSWVGDMVMAQSLFKVLSRRSNIEAIDVVAPAWSRPIIERMPEVRATIPLAAGHGELAFGTRRALGRSLRANGYGEALVLPRSFKAALVPFFAGIPGRIGYRGEMRFGLLTERRRLDRGLLTQTVQRFVALGLPADAAAPPETPAPALRVDAANQQHALGALGLDTARPIVGMMPGAEYGPAKCWPIERFGELAGRLTAAGLQVWVFGSDKDQAVGRRIADAGGNRVFNLCGRTSLADVVDLLALAPRVVTNDSGLMHVAAAVGAHVIALYGSSTPDFTPPLTDRATVFYRRLDCSPCFERECPLGHLECLKGITVEQVLEAAIIPS